MKIIIKKDSEWLLFQVNEKANRNEIKTELAISLRTSMID